MRTRTGDFFRTRTLTRVKWWLRTRTWVRTWTCPITSDTVSDSDLTSGTTLDIEKLYYTEWMWLNRFWSVDVWFVHELGHGLAMRLASGKFLNFKLAFGHGYEIFFRHGLGHGLIQSHDFGHGHVWKPRTRTINMISFYFRTSGKNWTMDIIV